YRGRRRWPPSPRAAAGWPPGTSRRTSGGRTGGSRPFNRRFYASAEAHLTQQETAQRGARILELREDREVVMPGHVDRLAREPAGPPHGGELFARRSTRSEEHTSELQSRFDLVCRLLLEKKKKTKIPT